MKLSRIRAAALIVGFILFSLGAAILCAQQPVSKAKVLGTWDIEVVAEGQSYFLNMVLTETAGQFAGTISEQNGVFTDVALSSLNYDGQNLSFEFNSPTPPDGMQRLLQVTFAWADDALEGSVTIPDLGMTIPAKATKKS